MLYISLEGLSSLIPRLTLKDTIRANPRSSVAKKHVDLEAHSSLLAAGTGKRALCERLVFSF
jgi:hypothetical protein